MVEAAFRKKRGQTHYSLNGRRWKQSGYAGENASVPFFAQEWDAYRDFRRRKSQYSDRFL